MDRLNEFAKRLRQFITEAQLSQQELCELLDRTKGAVSHWLSGRLLPNYDTLVHIGQRLGISLDWLCGFADAPVWNEQVHRLGLRLSRALLEKPGSALTSGERLLQVLTLAESLAPEFVTRRYAAAIAGVSPRTLEAMREGRLESVSTAIIQRVADFSGIPVRWFWTGDPDDLAPPDMSEYQQAVALLAMNGIAPRDLVGLLETIKALKQSLLR